MPVGLATARAVIDRCRENLAACQRVAQAARPRTIAPIATIKSAQLTGEIDTLRGYAQRIRADDAWNGSSQVSWKTLAGKRRGSWPVEKAEIGDILRPRVVWYFGDFSTDGTKVEANSSANSWTDS